MTNTITGLETFYRWNDALMGAPVGVLVLIVCIALGYALKLLPFVDNKWIPGAVLLAGMACFPLLSERPPGELLRVWLTKMIVLGLVAACAAWFIHNQFLKRIEQKLGWFQQEGDTTP